MLLYDYLIVGAGLYGAAFAHQAKMRGHRCLVIDKRPQTGGNLYCSSINGINVHKYGAHIFHTSNKQVWDYINAITPFNRYTNSPLAYFKGKMYNLPFNMNTFYQLWGVTTPKEAKRIIDEQIRDAGIQRIDNLEEQALALVGKDIYETFIKGYTEKQWGRKCTDLPSFIIRRLPVRFVYDNNYFADTYQGIPIGGYNRLIDGLLSGVECRCGVDFFGDADALRSMAKTTVYTGQIDEYFQYRLGRLEYRTVKFEDSILNECNYQGNAVVNYTNTDVAYTRIIEHKHFESFGDEVYRNPTTVISKEYPVEWKEGLEPYYPINNSRNQHLYNQYKELARQEENVIWGGRLAEYNYYDMNQIIENILNLFNKSCHGKI